MASMNNKRIQNDVNLRKLVLELVIEIMEESVFCDKALHHALEKHSLDKRDRSFITRLTEGTVERCIQLDYIINQFSKIRVDKMKPVIRNILRISVYQIFFMDLVPDSAACNEAVKLVEKRKLHNLKGFVNGVLRNIARNKDNISYPPKKDFVSYASIYYSMPEWIVTYLSEAYGQQETERILAAFLEEKGQLSVRCTLNRFSTEQVMKTLEQQEVNVCKSKLLPYALRISNYPSLKELSAFCQGMFQVQDESSMLVGEIAGIKQGDTVVDVCAAPGGKTLHAADILRGSGKVIAADLTKEKIALMQENVQRLDYQNVEILKNDATVLRTEWIEKADVVIADLPCSGLGVIGKKCDIKYKTHFEDIVELARIQRDILSVVSQYVKSGGRLVFSTCTIASEENLDNVEWIEKNLPFKRVSIEESLPKVFKGKTGMKGYLQVLPGQADTDGFFLSCFQKK